ncbi:MAG: hypothetical protein C0498_05060 [Anaerolinea sp.]|nr:hypothetical protein [Anaerolinea sp.]
MKRPKGRRTILFGVVLGLALSGGLAYVRLTTAEGPPEPVPDPGAGQYGPMIALEERVVNLQAGGAFRYAKIGVTVEIRPLDASFYTLVGEERAAADELARKEYEPMVPLLLDALGTVVSSRTSSDLVAVDGRARLKEELIGAMGVVLGEQAVLNVYFTDLVMQ